MGELLKSRHAFGSEANIDYAISQGLVDAYDILFLKEGKIGWIDKEGNKVILENKKQVVSVEALPEIGDVETVYICDSKFYFWNGVEFILSAGSINETIVYEKIETAVNEANAYTDEQIANAIGVVEF